MATKQETYRAFMENVCNKFNCKEALPALTEGFKAFCEASALDDLKGTATLTRTIHGRPYMKSGSGKWKDQSLTVSPGLMQEIIDFVENRNSFGMTEDVIQGIVDKYDSTGSLSDEEYATVARLDRDSPKYDSHMTEGLNAKWHEGSYRYSERIKDAIYVAGTPDYDVVEAGKERVRAISAEMNA